MLKNLLNTTFRNFFRNKTYNFLNIFGLAIGVDPIPRRVFLFVKNELFMEGGSKFKLSSFSGSAISSLAHHIT